MYEYLIDLLVVIFAICVGVEIHFTSMNRSEPTWARNLEMAFCGIFSVDLLIRICIERERFGTGCGPRQCLRCYTSYTCELDSQCLSICLKVLD